VLQILYLVNVDGPDEGIWMTQTIEYAWILGQKSYLPIFLTSTFAEGADEVAPTTAV
jgi:hypothetical protein